MFLELVVFSFNNFRFERAWRSDWPLLRRVGIETTRAALPTPRNKWAEIIWTHIWEMLSTSTMSLQISTQPEKTSQKLFSKSSRYSTIKKRFKKFGKPFDIQVVHMTLAETIFVYISAFLIVLIIGLNVVVGISAGTDFYSNIYLI